MYVRLGFSIAALAKPDILLIDEVLAVGDFGFQRKCISKMQEYISEGGCLVVVTHDMLALNSLCKQCLVLAHGGAVYFGDVANAADIYVKEATKSNLGTAKSYSLSTKEIRYGSRECEIRSLEFLNKGGVDDKNYSNVIISGEEAIAKLTVYSHKSMKKIHVGISVWDMSGMALFTMNTIGMYTDASGIGAGMKKEYTFRFQCPLNAGRYMVGAGIYNPETGEYLDRRLKWKILSVFAHNEVMGLLQVPYQISTNLLSS